MCSENSIQALIVAKLFLLWNAKIDYRFHNSMSEVCADSPHPYIVLCLSILYYLPIDPQIIQFVIPLRFWSKILYTSKMQYYLLHGAESFLRS